jgi:hypothetical protein
MSLPSDVQRLMNEPVMNADAAKLALISGNTEGLTEFQVITNVIFPMMTGLQNAVMHLATEVEKLGRT